MIKQVADYDLSSRNTFRMKVRCALYVDVTQEEDLTVLDFDSLPQPVMVMGGGSNLLFTKDFPGTVLHVGIVSALDQVQGIFGPGHILPPGPGPATMPHSTFSATLLGPGPAPKITPRPNTPWTRSTQVEDINVVFDVQTFYEKMFLEMGLPITYMAFTLEHEGPFVSPGEAFDHSYWLEQEGPRRSFSHQPNKKN